MQKKLLLIFLSGFFSYSPVIAQIPDGYYQAAQNLTGQELRSALTQIVTNIAVKIPYGSGYLNGIWGAYVYTDVHPVPDSTIIWDMYSDVPGGQAAYYYTIGTNQCGNAAKEGDCYSREHSFPKSYWGGEGQTGTDYPQYTDLFHLFPADQYVNNRRNNNPYGEVTSPTWTSTNGGKLGPNSFGTNYTGTVFEPIDDYKGDIARGYFYMATRYMNVFASWEKITSEGDAIMDGDDYAPWFKELLLTWNDLDPVSQKELDRNNAIYYKSGQGNRNPFIDHPEYVHEIWGSVNNEPWFTSTPIPTAYTGQTYSYEVTANDNDDQAVLSFHLLQGPAWISLEDHGNKTATLSGVPGNDNMGDFLVTMSVLNNQADSAVQEYYLTVEEGSSISFSVANTLKVYPNPAKTSVSFASITGEMDVTFFNLMGTKVKSEHLLTNTMGINDLKNGQYLILVNQQNRVYTSLLTISR